MLEYYEIKKRSIEKTKLKTFYGIEIVKKDLKKEDKLKFTDVMTSLKNRNYLNAKMPEWGECNVYPQAVVIVDLNKVKYVNDNYGHEEGDQLIIKAAGILVNTQLENSEIIRTDGNEFLVYINAPKSWKQAYDELKSSGRISFEKQVDNIDESMCYRDDFDILRIIVSTDDTIKCFCVFVHEFIHYYTKNKCLIYSSEIVSVYFGKKAAEGCVQ